jgi:hypothetical protein
MKIITLFIVTLSLLFAEGNEPKEEGIIDKSHKEVVETLDKNVDELPESLQGTAKDAINTIEKDGKNINFNLQLLHVHSSTHSMPNGEYYELVGSEQILSFGATFFPNTWDLSTSFSYSIGKDLFFPNPETEERKEILSSYQGNYLMNESEKPTYWLDVYTKPIKENFGEIGFGIYKYEKSMPVQVTNPGHPESTGTVIKAINHPNSSGTGAYEFQDDSYIFRHTEKVDQLYITYNIPSIDSWYNGLGARIGYEKTNRRRIVEPFKILVNPDTSSYLWLFGINKTLDEINTGISFKKFTIGNRFNNHKFYNYETNKDEELSETTSISNVEIIFMFKPGNDKMFFFSGELVAEDERYQSHSLAKLELGMLF